MFLRHISHATPGAEAHKFLNLIFEHNYAEAAPQISQRIIRSGNSQL